MLDAQYDTGEKQGNSSRKNEEAKPKWKQHPVVDMTGNGSKVRYCKEQLHRNQECYAQESRLIGSGETGDGKSEH